MSGSGPEPPKRDPWVEAAVETGARAWPELGLSRERFAAYVVDRLRPGPDGADAPLHAADLYLACSCVERIPSGLAAFDQHHLQTLPARLRRLHLAPSFLDELTQVLRVRLLVAAPGEQPRIALYAGRGALHAWVRAAAVRAALNLKRSTWREELVAEGEPPLEPAAAADRELRRGAYAAAVASALPEVTRNLGAEDRLLLQMHFVDGQSAAEIGRLLGVNRVTAHRRLVRAYRSIERGVLALVRDRLGLSDGDLDSVRSITRSRLELSVGALLASG